MVEVAELIHTCDMPLPVAMSCLGSCIPTRIGGVDAELLLPTIERRTRNDRPKLAPPHFQVLVGDVDWDRFFREPVDFGTAWGDIHAWHAEDMTVGSPNLLRFGVRFAASDDEQLEVVYDRVVNDQERWWESLKEWIEILAAIDMTTENLGKVIAPETAWTRPAEGGPRRSIARHGITILVPPDKEPISYDNLSRAARLAGAEEPPLEWRLIRAARQSRWRGQYRASVLDAGTAAEVALTKLIETRLDGIPKPIREALLDKYRALENRADLLKRLGGEVPREFTGRLRDPRNRATHTGEEVAPATAIEAERIASAIVQTATPLP